MPTPVMHYVYEAADGRRASVSGACPWQTDLEKILNGWRMVEDGWTVQWSDGTTGNCPRFSTREEAEIYIAGHGHDDFVDVVWMPVWRATYEGSNPDEGRRLLETFKLAIAEYLSSSSDDPAADWRQLHELLDLEPTYIDAIHGAHNVTV